MSNSTYKDLAVLVADSDIRAVLEELIGGRYSDMGIRSVNFDTFRGPYRDPGCRTDAHNLLRRHCGIYNHALVVFDLEGSGGKGRAKTERMVEDNLARNGWPGGRAAAIVIEPELEAWAWCSPNNLQSVRRTMGVQSQSAFSKLVAEAEKDPKDAFEMACRQAGKNKSPERYRELAERLPVQNCQDPAFQKLMTTLQRWFS